MNLFYMLKQTFENMNLSSILDILVISYIFYKGYKIIRQTRAEQLIKGCLLVVLLIPISQMLHLKMLNLILERTLTIGVLSVIIIFQPEIRRGLEHLGRSAFNNLSLLEDEEVMDEVLTELVNGVENLSKTKTGALIIIEQKTGLSDLAVGGTQIDAKITSQLLENIFFHNAPLHDGALIIRNDRILSASCVLPLTTREDVNKALGTRHRAALGLTELTDAIAVIVSEETGVISLSINGKLTRNYDKDRLKEILIKILERRKNSRKTTIREKVLGWKDEIMQIKKKKVK